MRLFSCLLLSLGLSSSPLIQAAPQKLATVEVTVEGLKAEEVAGIRTLYVIVYDNASQGRMPYGAMKVDLKADAKGVLYKGDLTTDNVQRMNKDAPLPKSIRLKARLDKDGAAGADQAGDLVGKLDKLDVGQSAKITINTKI